MNWIKWTDTRHNEFYENLDAIVSHGQLSTGQHYIKYVGSGLGENVPLTPQDYLLFLDAFLEHYKLFNGVDTRSS